MPVFELLSWSDMDGDHVGDNEVLAYGPGM